MTTKIDEKIMETVRKMDAYLSVSKEINNKMSTESVREFLQMVLSIISNTKDDFDTLSESRMQEIEDALSYIVSEYKTMCDSMDGKSTEAIKKMQGILTSADFLLEQVKTDRENLMEDLEQKMEETIAQCQVDHNGMMEKMDEYKELIPSPYILSATEVRDELQSLKGAERLDISAIKGIDELEKRLLAQIASNKGKPVSAGFRGGNYGIKSIKAGSNVTITYNGDPSNGDITISATGGGGGGSQTLADTSTLSDDGTKSTYQMTDAVSITYLDSDGATVFKMTETGRLGIGTASPTHKLHVVGSTTGGDTKLERTTSGTTALAGAAMLLATSTGDMADGFGVQLGFDIQDDAGVVNRIAVIAATRAGADGTGDLGFYTSVAGSNTGSMSISSGKNLSVGSTVTLGSRLGIYTTRTAVYNNNFNFLIDAGTFTDSSSSGTVSNITGGYIYSTTVAATSVTTYTNATTWYIAGGPTAGSNVTITNKYALWIGADTTRLDGTLYLNDINVLLGTTTGTKFGTSTSQKLGFYNATPIVQPTGNIITALQNLGLVASGTLPASSVSSGAALSRVDDTNVTLTLGGTPSTALLASASLTLGWTGTLAVARGGTGTGSAGIGAFNNITGYTASGATGTTSTNLVFSTSPTFTTSINLTSTSAITFNTTDVVLTHSTGILTMGTGELRITTVGTNTASVPTLGSTSTFTNKTLTSPKIGTSILDTNGNELFILTATASAVNEVTYANAATGTDPSFTMSGSDSNIGFKFITKGTGYVKGVLKRFAVRLVESTTDTATGTAIGGDFRLSRNPITIINVGAYVDTAGTTGLMTIDINEGGTTIMSTNKITLDSTEKTSETAATAPGVTDTAIAADGIITIDVDGVQTTKAKGLTVWIDYVEA